MSGREEDVAAKIAAATADQLVKFSLERSIAGEEKRGRAGGDK